jgi:hypothetical protein
LSDGSKSLRYQRWRDQWSNGCANGMKGGSYRGAARQAIDSASVQHDGRRTVRRHDVGISRVPERGFRGFDVPRRVR